MRLGIQRFVAGLGEIVTVKKTPVIFRYRALSGGEKDI